MDKNFARILMLSALLPAGVSLAHAIDHDYPSVSLTHPAFASSQAKSSAGDSAREHAVEGRRFLELVAAEENAVARRFTR